MDFKNVVKFQKGELKKIVKIIKSDENYFIIINKGRKKSDNHN